jgi:hypothetical protein
MMRIHKHLSVALLLGTMLLAGVASAESLHAVGPADMQAAIATQIGDQTAQRAAIQSLLARPAVRQLAANSGLDLARAQAAASQLQGVELQRLAAQATAIDTQLAGGDQTVVISVTVLLLIIILIVLLVG